jgi:hypothetical protein
MACAASSSRIMPDVDSIRIEQHVFSNIRCMVRKSLQIPCNGKETERRFYVLPIIFHKGNQLVKAIRAKAVHNIIRREYFAS